MMGMLGRMGTMGMMGMMVMIGRMGIMGMMGMMDMMGGITNYDVHVMNYGFRFCRIITYIRRVNGLNMMEFPKVSFVRW